MRPGRLTIVLLAVCALLLLIPAVRRPVRILADQGGLHGSGFPTGTEVQKATDEHPDDAELWLAVAELRAAGEDERMHPLVQPQGSAEVAFDRAVELQPESPAARVRYAMYHLAQAGDLLRQEEPGADVAGRSRTPDETYHLNAAYEMLAECQALDPDNAAVDAWLAWTLFAMDKDTEAFAALEGVSADARRDTYHSEAIEALLLLHDAVDAPPAMGSIMATSVVSGFDLGVSSKTRSLARLLTGLGDEHRAEGRPVEAVRCYRVCAEMGHAIRANAKNMIDGLVGIAVAQIPTGGFGSRAERQQLRNAAGDSDEWRRQLDELRVERLCGYMSQHGDAQFAEWYEADIEAGIAWKADAKAANLEMLPRLIRNMSSGGVLNTVSLGVVLLPMVVVAVLVGLMSLLVACWREPKQQNRWSLVSWILLLALCVAPGQIAAFIGAAMIQASTEAQTGVATGLVGLVPLLGVVAWVVVVIVMALKRRSSDPSASQLSKPRSVLSGLRAVVLPTLAALLMLCLISAIPATNALDRAEQENRVMVMDEVKYWGIGEGGPR